MYKHLFLLCVSLLFTPAVVSSQSISDKQLIEYVKKANAEGKSQNEIYFELRKRGVTTGQIERLKTEYKNSLKEELKKDTTTISPRTREQHPFEMEDVGEKLPLDDPKKEKRSSEKEVFGKDIFNNPRLNFAPSVNIATPLNYRLGPGDEVLIEIWGSSENSMRETVSPEGSINIEQLGPVYLNGMTVKEAEDFLKRTLSKIYSGLEDESSDMKLSLGRIRTIQVNILGEVETPGTYQLSSFSTVLNALYRAGGISDIGTLRNIAVSRGGKTIYTIDLYNYILKGEAATEKKLQEGDVILVPPYECLVNVAGKAKRPMFYEMKREESIETLIKYAGGFTGDAYTKRVRLLRMGAEERQLYNIDAADFSSFRLMDEDLVEIDSILERFENRVEIYGAVYREGMYQISEEIVTLNQLIERADGLRGDAFLDRVQLQRERADLTHEIIPLNLKAILNGTAADIALKPNDMLYIPSIFDLMERKTVIIHGEVAQPDTFLFAEKLTIEDLIIKAGGLKEAASTACIEVARRIKKPGSTEFEEKIGQTFIFNMENGYLTEKGDEFYLEPFDEVYVRRSPAYQIQRNVAIGGEIKFAGSYTLTERRERLNDLVKRAGGITPSAYTKGARLIRKMNKDEIKRKNDLLRMAAQTTDQDTIISSALDVSDYYTVGIDLQKALNQPGSDYDMILREGDMLFIPEYNGTVKINGAVMHPNAVSYVKGADAKYYIDQAGGYNNIANKRKTYIIYMNGYISRVHSDNSSTIEPGCEIVVPSKNTKNRMSTAEKISIGSSTASIALMITTMINLLIK